MPQYAEVICKLTPENQPLLFHLADRIRSRKTNRILGGFLTFSAGAINAGGFLAVGQYTSHMTGIISSVADNLALSKFRLAIAGILAFVSFVSGAASTSLFINWARRRRVHSEFAISIALEAILLLVFGLIGANLNVYLELFIPTTVVLLTYIMGLQNAIITKISKAEIRTTHMTGVITDLGIELGRLLYWNRHKAIPPRPWQSHCGSTQTCYSCNDIGIVHHWGDCGRSFFQKDRISHNGADIGSDAVNSSASPVERLFGKQISFN